MDVRLSKISLVAVLALVAPAGAQNAETFAERSQARARAVVDAAVKAHGGEAAIRAIERVVLRLDGELSSRLQSATVEPPHDLGTYEERVTIDLRGNRLLAETKTVGAGFANAARAVIAGGEGQLFDLRAKTVRKLTPAEMTSAAYFRFYRRTPVMVLRSALDRALSLRYLGEERIDGRKHDVVTFVHDEGSQLALYVDAETGLLRKYEIGLQDSIEGEEATEFFFDGYQTTGGLALARELTIRQVGEVVQKMRVDVRFNEPIEDRTFAVSAESFAEAPQARTPQETTTTLADGVVLVQGVGGNANVLAVAFKEYVVAVEAPNTTAACDGAIARIKAAFPGKPIRYVAITHHHSDHLGGLRAFMREGATVVTTAGNRRVVEALATSTGLRDGFVANARRPAIELLGGGRRVFEDETQRLELIDIGPNPHAREMVVAYLPKHRIVFQGDLFNPPLDERPAEAAHEATLHFARSLAKHSLVVDRIVGVHGRVATVRDLEDAVTRGEALK